APGFLPHKLRVRRVPAAQFRRDLLGEQEPDVLGPDHDVETVFRLRDIGDEREALPARLERGLRILCECRGDLDLVRARTAVLGTDLDDALVIAPADPVAPVALFLYPRNINLAGALNRLSIERTADRD